MSVGRRTKLSALEWACAGIGVMVCCAVLVFVFFPRPPDPVKEVFAELGEIGLMAEEIEREFVTGRQSRGSRQPEVEPFNELPPIPMNGEVSVSIDDILSVEKQLMTQYIFEDERTRLEGVVSRALTRHQIPSIRIKPMLNRYSAEVERLDPRGGNLLTEEFTVSAQ